MVRWGKTKADIDTRWRETGWKGLYVQEVPTRLQGKYGNRGVYTAWRFQGRIVVPHLRRVFVTKILFDPWKVLHELSTLTLNLTLTGHLPKDESAPLTDP